MERLNKTNLNTPELSEKIFKSKWKEGVHNIDTNRFKEMIRDFKGGKYLDIGCFNSPKPGELSKDPKNEIHALDHSRGVVEKMQEKFPEVNYHVGDCYKLPFEKEYFDYVVAGEILEHLESPMDFVREAMRVLKVGGTMAISTPYMEDRVQPIISDEHLWSFDNQDMYELFSPYGRVEITINSDNLRVFIVYVKKN